MATIPNSSSPAIALYTVGTYSLTTWVENHHSFDILILEIKCCIFERRMQIRKTLT